MIKMRNSSALIQHSAVAATRAHVPRSERRKVCALLADDGFSLSPLAAKAIGRSHVVTDAGTVDHGASASLKLGLKVRPGAARGR